MRMRILHVITGLQSGGAEAMLYKLLSASHGAGFTHAVVALTSGGPYFEKIRDLGVDVQTLDLNMPLVGPGAIFQLRRKIADFDPDIVQGWMYHADLLTSLALMRFLPGKAGTRPPLVWNVRLSEIDPRFIGWSTRLVIRCLATLSHRVPAAIVINAEASRQTHIAAGYTAQKFQLIPNGFDLEKFKPDPAARAALRRELGIAPETRLVGMAARFDPQKDYPAFFAAAEKVIAACGDVAFIACGSGVEAANPAIAPSIARGDIARHLHLLGRRGDMERFYPALDIYVSTAIGEGFANVVGEAMCCAVPCIVTDVGDSRVIVGDSGVVVPPADPAAMARAVIALLDGPAHNRQAMGARARTRMGDFSIAAVARRFEAMWQTILSDKKAWRDRKKAEGTDR
ncbi:MAG TPA: hypothetical protein DCO73_08305 [Alphaproteobacteria bacterium]|nr:hypothetical protein [Alphaproteobacteria bacterium]